MISKIKGNRNILLLVIGCMLYAVTLKVHKSFEMPLTTISKQDSSLNFNTDFIRLFSVGNKKLISDVLWVQTLLESDLERYSRKDLGNWMFLRFKTISALDPLFYENYYYGGLYLSIVKDDLRAASIIYDKGLEVYPDDYNLNYNAGFNYYFEMGNYSRGLALLDKIKDHPKAPKLLPSIVNKLKLATGVDIRLVFNLVMERYSKADEPSIKQKLYDELYSIKAEIDLSCLNSDDVTLCDRNDFEGHPYVKKTQGYAARKIFLPYRLKRKY